MNAELDALGLQGTLREAQPAHRRPVNLRLPVIALLLAGTAVPVEIWPSLAIGDSVQLVDVLLNTGAFMVVGIVWGRTGLLKCMGIAAGLSLLAECSQLFMLYRDPSFVDVASNLGGALLGAVAARAGRIPHHLVLRGWMAIAAAVLAAGILTAVALTASPGLSARGAAAEGTLEGHWKFDAPVEGGEWSATPRDLRAVPRGEVGQVTGVHGRAVSVDGNGYIDAGQPAEMRLVGDLSISAWIRPRAHPRDDAAIVSSLEHVGYPDGTGVGSGFQLDTTVDTGPRTIGFKIADSCGQSVARYGTTALQLGHWYFIAGVYDSKRRTLDVYLDGRPDNGPMSGSVPGLRRSSRQPLFIGARPDRTGYAFAGDIDDVRVYSRALSQADVAADMRSAAAVASPQPVSTQSSGAAPNLGGAQCPWAAESRDKNLPAAAGVLGLLLGLAGMGLYGFRSAIPGVALAMAGGCLLYRLATPTLPPFNAWTLPLTSFATALALAIALRTTPPQAGGAARDQPPI